MMICPYCASGDRINHCRCAAALHASRHGKFAADKIFPHVGNARPARVVPNPDPKPVKPRASPKAVEKLREAIPPAPTAPWLAEPGVCPSCDRRRAATVEANKTARKRRKSGVADIPSAVIGSEP